MNQKELLVLQSMKDPSTALEYFGKTWKDAKVYDQPRVFPGEIRKVRTLEASFIAGSAESVLRAIKSSVLCKYIEQESSSYVRIVIGLKSN